VELNLIALMLIISLVTYVESSQLQQRLDPIRRQATLTATVVRSEIPAKGDLHGEIAFSSTREGGLAIFVMDIQAKTVRRLTNTDGNLGPAWSPDGKRIAFSSDRTGRSQIYIMNADGSSEINISQNTDSDGEPRWSPDGQQIAFVSVHENSFPQIYTMAPDGTHRRRLTGLGSLHPLDGSFPTWSPDGKQIAFSSAHDGSPAVFVMNADGTNVILLVEGPSYPVWSPDAKYIATVELPPAINIIDVSAPQAVSPFPKIADGVQPAWSPDRKHIAFVKQPLGGKSQIFIANLDGTNQFTISDPNAYEGDPDWKPDQTVAKPS
jgi:Tol biopolymer transport system component